MNANQAWTAVSAVLVGLVYFGIVMAVSMGLVMLNVRQSPEITWFPLPVTIFLIASVWWAQRHWNIGLAHTSGVPWTRVYIVGIALTILGVATALVQGKFTGMVRATELIDADVSPLFAMTYAIYMSVLAAVLAEVTFRGVIQTRMQTVMGIWPVVVTIGVINVLAHRWGPELTLNWLGLFVTLAGWTYLRWLSRSLWPPLVLHAVCNFIVAIALWYRGPLVHAELATGTVVAIALTGLICLGVAIALGRRVHPAETATS